MAQAEQDTTMAAMVERAAEARAGLEELEQQAEQAMARLEEAQAEQAAEAAEQEAQDITKRYRIQNSHKH